MSERRSCQKNDEENKNDRSGAHRVQLQLVSCESSVGAAALAACAPKIKNYTRERLRPLLRVYFIGRRFGSILVSPVPLFTSMI